MYIPIEEFDALYPRNFRNILGEGSYGTVYESGAFAIKEQHDDVLEYLFQSTIPEINFYSRFRHPCIIKLSHWSFDTVTDADNDNTRYFSYMAIEKGVPVKTALSQCLTTIHDVVRDLLSAVRFLEENNVVHNDIKPGNMVFVNGHSVLIDFGMAYQGRRYLNDVMVMRGHRGTHLFSDPQLLSSAPISIKTDLYSVGTTLYCLSINKNSPSTIIFDMITPSGDAFVNKIKTPIDDIILECCRFPISHRLNATEIMKKFNIDYMHGAVLETLHITLYECSSIRIGRLADYLTTLHTRHHNNIQTLFLTLHLIHRTIERILPQYSVKGSFDGHNILLLGQCCCFLSQLMYERDTFSFEDLRYYAEESYDLQAYHIMTIQILIELKGVVITTTGWDFAFNRTELVHNYINLCGCHYSYPYTFQAEDIEISSKDITVNKFLESVNSLIGERISVDLINKPIYKDFSVIGKPHPIQTEAPHKAFVYEHKYKDTLEFDPGILLYYYDDIIRMDPKDPILRRIYSNLYNLSWGYHYLLKRILHFDMKTYGKEHFDELNLNPFVATDDDIKRRMTLMYKLRKTFI